jgi:outer membrane biosynthesis protein TonB
MILYLILCVAAATAVEIEQVAPQPPDRSTPVEPTVRPPTRVPEELLPSAGVKISALREELGRPSGRVETRASSPVEALGPQVPPAGEPGFTPMTVRPSLTNAEEVRQALLREYPAVLRAAGIGGVATLWVHIDVNGVVSSTRIFESSGFEALVSRDRTLRGSCASARP